MGVIRPVISTNSLDRSFFPSPSMGEGEGGGEAGGRRGNPLQKRGSMVLRGLVGSVVCLALLASACNDSQKPQESTQPAPQVTAVAPPAPSPVALQFSDVTATAG